MEREESKSTGEGAEQKSRETRKIERGFIFPLRLRMRLRLPASTNLRLVVLAASGED
jgi:hypothetical protein